MEHKPCIYLAIHQELALVKSSRKKNKVHLTKCDPVCKYNTAHILINMKYTICDVKLLYGTSFKISRTKNIFQGGPQQVTRTRTESLRVNICKDGLLPSWDNSKCF